MDWSARTEEERSLLTPSFCATLLWSAAAGHYLEANRGIPFEVAFLVCPFVLHRATRELLPRSAVTSLPVWLQEHPLARSGIAERARLLVPFTKDALTFGGTRGLLRVSATEVIAMAGWKRRIDRALTDTSNEVRACGKRAEFLGRWFARVGDGATTLALLGVRP